MRQKLRVILIGLIVMLVATAAAHAASAPPALLKEGMSGDDIYRLQVKLQEFGYYQGTPDGYFGEQTAEAVMEFQLDTGLQVDGIVGAATLATLRDFKPAAQASRAPGESRHGLQIVAFAKQFLGIPYVWAGRSPGGFDCSGFVWYVYNHFGIHLPRMADGQFETGAAVGRRSLVPGDLVFFSTYEPGPSHVGIYIGGGKFIHASSGAGEVTITPLSKQYYVERYIGARRLVR
jgi:cell wall-associated NlpC family hydrolase